MITYLMVVGAKMVTVTGDGIHKNSDDREADRMDIPPKGKRISVNQINIKKLKASRIAAYWRITGE